MKNVMLEMTLKNPCQIRESGGFTFSEIFDRDNYVRLQGAGIVQW